MNRNSNFILKHGPQKDCKSQKTKLEHSMHVWLQDCCCFAKRMHRENSNHKRTKKQSKQKKRSAATAPKLLKTDRHAAQGPKHMDTQMKCFLSHFNKVTLKNSTNTAVMTVVTY